MGLDELPVMKALRTPVKQRSTGSAKDVAVTIGAAVGAVFLALAIAAILLVATGISPWTAYRRMFTLATESSTLYDMLKRSTPLMLSAVAVAIGFKMNMFNIGVEGQYKVGAFLGAIVGAQFSAPPVIHVAIIIVVAMIGGAFWAAIAAVLKVSRGVNEVISTIMLNFIALSVLQFLFDNWFRDDTTSGLNVKTKLLPTSGWVPDIVKGRLSWFFVIALGVVAAYWLIVFKSRFGFRLRASGLNAIAARTAGISSKRMIVMAMILSGAVAGLVGLPAMLGEIHAYGQDLPKNKGFEGIAVALLGRNHPVGIVAAAMLFGLLSATSGGLQIAGVPNSIIDIIQAITVLTVVIVNEAVTRWLNNRTAQRAAAAIEMQGAAA